MNLFTDNNYRELAGKCLPKEKILNLFEIDESNFSDRDDNNELIYFEANDSIVFPIFQFTEELNKINFGDVVKDLIECMSHEYLVVYLLTDNYYLKAACNFTKPIDALKNGYRKEVVLIAQSYDILELVHDSEDPFQELLSLLNH